MSTSVEYLSDALEIFLPGSVPYLQFYFDVVNFKEKSSEFDSNCDVMLFHELIGRNTVHETRFADSRVTYDD